MIAVVFEDALSSGERTIGLIQKGAETEAATRRRDLDKYPKSIREIENRMIRDLKDEAKVYHYPESRLEVIR